jgi:hypothetical protein
MNFSRRNFLKGSGAAVIGLFAPSFFGRPLYLEKGVFIVKMLFMQ